MTLKALIFGLLMLSLTTLTTANGATSEVVAADDINWGYLNPLRGKLSPGAADLWGNRIANEATGMLVRFNKGFSSPPHIHNITYRGVVIQGLLHNDDPGAEKMWMPTGSFWTQPAGENHITSANEDFNMIYLEIDSGPYLVKPATEQFDNGERPVNLHYSNMVWLDKSDVYQIEAEGAETAFLWGSTDEGKPGGFMLKLPSGFNGKISATAGELRVVVIKGEVNYSSKDIAENKILSAGSYFGSSGKFDHKLATKADEDAMLYIRSDHKFQVN